MQRRYSLTRIIVNNTPHAPIPRTFCANVLIHPPMRCGVMIMTAINIQTLSIAAPLLISWLNRQVPPIRHLQQHQLTISSASLPQHWHIVPTPLSYCYLT